MLRERLLDLDRIDVLAAADDHVLDPVGEEKVALLVNVAAVAGAEPAVRRQRRRRLVRPVEVARRHVRRPQPHLADLPRSELATVGRVDDAELHPRQRPTRRAEETLAGPVGVVVLGIELHDSARAFGEAVDAVQGAAKRPQRRLQHRRGDRRGAVRDRAQRRVVSVGCTWYSGQHLQHRRDEDRVGDARSLEQLENLLGDEFAYEDRRRAVPEAEEGPADSADVEHRQRRQADGVGVELPVGRRLGTGGEVLVRHQDALGDSGRSRGVELQHDVTGRAAGRRIDRVERREPPLVAVGDVNHGGSRAEPGDDLLGELLVDAADEQERRLRVREHAAHLRRGEAPVERDRDGSDLARREQQLDDLGRRAVEVGDARTGADARRE